MAAAQARQGPLRRVEKRRQQLLEPAGAVGELRKLDVVQGVAAPVLWVLQPEELRESRLERAPLFQGWLRAAWVNE